MIKCINYDGVSIVMDDTSMIEENILLKKQLKSLSTKVKKLEKQNKALQQYVPFLNLSHIVDSNGRTSAYVGTQASNKHHGHP